MNPSTVILLFEMLFINLVSINFCCQRKYSLPITILTLFGFSCLMFVFSSRLFPSFGSGQSIVYGFLYLLPFFILYEEKKVWLFLVTCMCWIYTILAFVLSIQISRLLPALPPEFCHLLMQTAFYLLTLYPFFKWIIPKYLFLVQNLDHFDRSYTWCLGCSCFLHYFILWFLHLILLEQPGTLLHVLLVLLYTALALITYLILYRMMRDSLRIQQLEQLSLQDSLTGLGNRTRLISDLQQLLAKNQKFSILFMDLDHFKEINDHYGHIVGDRYLQHFAEIISRILSGCGEVYRFGGDEFVALCPNTLPPGIMEQLRACQDWADDAPCPFNQVSIGSVACHPPFPDISQILQAVDHRMYEMKHAREQQGRTQA